MRRVTVSKKSSHFFASCLCIISSAAFYAASFLWMEACWFFSFFCFIPLFAQSFSSYVSAAAAGFLWGLVAYSFTLSALIELIIRLGTGTLKYWYALGFLAYFTFFSMLWFLVARWLALETRRWSVGWFFSSFLYFSWMHLGFFYFLTARLQGYGLACPAVPLIQAPQLLGLLPWLHWYGLVGALFVFQFGVAQRKWFLILLGAVPFLAGILVPEKKLLYENQKVRTLSTSFCRTLPYERAEEVKKVLLRAEQEFPDAILFVLPESTFPFPLNKYRDVQEMWSDAGTLKNKYIAIGSHYSCVGEDGKGVLYNSVYVLHNGLIVYRYDKQWLLPFFEQEVWWTTVFKVLKSPFLLGKFPFSCQDPFQIECIIPEVDTFSFRICSELLWDVPSHKQVIGMVHDGYYAFSYFPRLFSAFALFQALEHQSTLVYCGWKRL